MYLDKIKALNTNNLVCMLEIGYSSGVYIDNYINGNEIFSLDDFVISFKNTMLGSWDFKEFIINLKEYNKTLKGKIHIIGIDVEHQKNIAVKMLEYAKTQKIKNIELNVEKNIQNVMYLDSLSDTEYEIQREKILFNNIFENYNKEKDYICFMGLYHTKYNSKDYNVVKMIDEKKISFLSVDVIYKNTIRTIKDNDKFKSIVVNDSFEKEEHKYIQDKEIYINVNKYNIGKTLIVNGKKLEMF